MATNYVTLVNQGNSVTVGPPPVTGTLFERRGSEWLVLDEKIGLVASPRVDNAIVMADLASTAMSYSLGLQDAVAASDVISGIGFGREVFAADAITVSDAAGSNPNVRLSDAVPVTDSVVTEVDGGWEKSTRSVYHDGVDDYGVAEFPRSVMEGPNTVSFWFNVPVGAPAGYLMAVSMAGGITHASMRINFDTAWRVAWNGVNGGTLDFVYTDIRDGQWHHIAVTTDNTITTDGTAKVYFDGSLVLTKVGRAWGDSSWWTYVAPAEFYTGAINNFGSFTYGNVKVDEVTLFTSELSASDVTALYNSGVPINPNLVGSGPAHYWRMGEDASGTTIPDQSGNSSYDMTLHNGAAVVNDVPGYSPAYIPQTVLWIDASDSSTVTVTAPFSTTIVSVKDKGYENTNWSGAGTLSEQTFTADTSSSNAIYHSTISGVGNGLKFFRGNNSNFRGYCVLTPSTSPYNLTSGAGSAAIESDWLLWQICYVEHTTPGSLDVMSIFARGSGILQSYFGGGHSPAAFAEVEDNRLNTYQIGDWINGSTHFTNWKSTDTPTYTNPSGTLTLFCVQSYDDGGTRKYRYTKDGTTWFNKTITATNGTSISAAANKWEFGYSSGSSSQIVGIGEAGFCGGTVSDADIAQLYSYAEEKWNLTQFTPASIAGTVLWLDPTDESTITRSTPGDTTTRPASIVDKGHLNTAWAGAGTLSAQTFTTQNLSTTNLDIKALSGVANGNNLFVQDPVTNYGYYWMQNTPSTSPYNLTSGSSSAALDEDWVMWMVIYSSGSSTGSNSQLFIRGVRGNSPAMPFDVYTYFTRANVWGTEWVSGNQNVGFSVLLENSLKFVALKSYEVSGTRYFAMCEDGSTWSSGVAITPTAATPGASYNKWELGFRSVNSTRTSAIGEAGFISGTLSATDLKRLYDYCNYKYGPLDS